ncbi:unnamed protein product [Pylaiella littoralis]
MDLDEYDEEDVRSKQDIMSDFDEMEARWKIEPTPAGFSRILDVFQVTGPEDLLPQRVNDIHKTDWNKYLDMRDELKNRCDEALTADEAERFSRFQESIFHAHQAIMMFMRSCNCNGSFPTPLTPETLFWYSPLSEKDMTPYHFVVLYLLGELSRRRYRRLQGFVYKQVFLGSYPTHAWEELCDIKSIIRVLCDKETHCEMWKHSNTGGNFDACVKYLTNCLDLEFPDLNPKRRVWSFNDGIYDASDDSFTFYDQHIDDHLVSCKIIYKDFHSSYFTSPSRLSPKLVYDQLDTPLFDSIFEPQKWDSEMVWWMFVFIGRLFYEVSEMDSWQVIPFMKGVAGTGKSTVIRVIQMMYNRMDIGVISNNVEKKFGLSTIYNKTIFVVPELKGDFAMDQADFQSMVTGEELSMAVKHGNPLTGTWTTPGIMAGNESAGWEDKSGSISRRIVVFPFLHKVPQEKLNPGLMGEIKESEMPKIIRKSALAYLEAVRKFGGSDIWQGLPSRIREERKKLQFSTNPLYAFISSDIIALSDEEYTLESMFVTKLKAFAALKFPSSVITFTPDFYSYIFDEFGLKIRKDTLPWPRSSMTNVQTQNYLFGCKICDV